jgi:transcriptional regulator with XRE-family HTH domain
LRREEVAVLAGLSPTWYTYLEQGRNIRPSREVLDSLATVLRLNDDERRYVHNLAHGSIFQITPLRAEVSAGDLIREVVALLDESPFPAYAANHYCDLLAWNRAACEWYDDWGALPPDNRNIMRWMLLSPVARARLVDWEDDTREVVARWRAEAAKHPTDPTMRARIQEISRLSADFRGWWGEHRVVEHRSKLRRFRHDRLGVRTMRIVPITSPEMVPAGIVIHVPVSVG